MNKAKISIIIAVYNSESTLNQCINSCRKQSLSEIEIICLDDCSTDRTPHVLLRHSQFDNRVKVISLNKNSKQGIVRNQGIEIATGEYICFLDADDYLHDLTALEQLYHAIKPDLDIVIFSYRKYYRKFYYYSSPIIYNNLNEDIIYASSQDKINILLNNSIGLPWNKIYRRDFLIKENIRFSEHLLYEDIPFFFKTIILANKIKLLNKDFITYNKNTHSTMSVRGEVNNHIIANYIIVKDFLEQHNLYNTYEYPFIYKSYGALLQKFLIIPFIYKRDYLQHLQPLINSLQLKKYKLQLGKNFYKYHILQNIYLHNHNQLSLLLLVLWLKLRNRL